jgi:hypothetical protein
MNHNHTPPNPLYLTQESLCSALMLMSQANSDSELHPGRGKAPKGFSERKRRKASKEFLENEKGAMTMIRMIKPAQKAGFVWLKWRPLSFL